MLFRSTVVDCFPGACLPADLVRTTLVVADFRVPVLTRNTVQLHVNHARAFIDEGFSYTGSRERRLGAAGNSTRRETQSLQNVRFWLMLGLACVLAA